MFKRRKTRAVRLVCYFAISVSYSQINWQASSTESGIRLIGLRGTGPYTTTPPRLKNQIDSLQCSKVSCIGARPQKKIPAQTNQKSVTSKRDRERSCLVSSLRTCFVWDVLRPRSVFFCVRCTHCFHFFILAYSQIVMRDIRRNLTIRQHAQAAGRLVNCPASALYGDKCFELNWSDSWRKQAWIRAVHAIR